jgi:hypothetical protein
MTRTVTIQLESEVAAAMRRGELSGASRQLLDVVRELGAELSPLHPGLEGPELGDYYTVEVADDEDVAQVVGRLAELEAVGAAYVKPEEAPP